jgi:hypothetical protein
MPKFHPALAVWLSRHHGIVSRRQLHQLGVTPHQIEALIRVGELIVVHDAVYRHAVWPDTLLSQCVAVCAADPTIVVCCGGATSLWEFRKCSNLALHVSGTGTGLRLPPGVLHHRCPVMPASHVHERPDGIRVTSPARTVFDVTKHVSPTTLESIIEQGLRRSMFDIATLYSVGRLLCGRGRAGSTQFAAVMTSRPAWRRPADSHPEIELRRALDAVGIHLQPQASLRLHDGHVVHPDLGDPTVGFFIEIDDHEWHGGRLDATYDHQRDRLARLVGARVERVSTDEVALSTPAFIEGLAMAYHQHRTLSARSA